MPNREPVTPRPAHEEDLMPMTTESRIPPELVVSFNHVNGSDYLAA